LTSVVSNKLRLIRTHIKLFQEKCLQWYNPDALSFCNFYTKKDGFFLVIFVNIELEQDS